MVVSFFRRFFAVAAGAGAFLAPASCGLAEPYPGRPVRMIVPFPPGGSTDIMARMVAQKLADRLGEQVIVDNRGGAGGTIGMNLAARAAPDGHTLMMSTSITHTVGVSLYRKLPYNVLTDFAPITLAASVPLLLVVNPSVPAKSVKDLVALARAKPGELHYASPGNGTSGHLAAEMFKSMANVDIVHVPYKGGGPAMVDLIAGQVQMLILSAMATLPHVKTGKLRALALTSLTRSPNLPHIPTVSESGLPGYEVVLWYGLFAPARTPAAVIARLNKEVVGIMQSPEMRERLAGEAGQPVGNTPQQFQEIVRTDVAKWAKVVREAGIRVE
ncbi:MAG: tripartite tricarboxylate transporter substrate binding protein [Burkholderiales bacterium]|nr:tripartite tricarboxylate transporter substrate binding protein [Burkholderiales bacterium]